jgi:hypothetical protein
LYRRNVDRGACNSMMPRAVLALGACMIFLAAGGLVGGIALVVDPSGAMLGLPASFLHRLPVATYLLPGWFILLVYGVVPLIIVYRFRRRAKHVLDRGRGLGEMRSWLWVSAVLLSVVLIVWMLVQLALIGLRMPLQVVMLVLGLVMLALALSPSTRRYFTIARDAPVR